MRDNPNETLPLVDSEGHTLGSISRGEAHGGSMKLHPVVHLHVFNSRGELYLQHRPMWKSTQPGKWDTACGGHIAYGETPQEALKREVSEELGMTRYTPQFVARYIFNGKKERELVYVNQTIYDGHIHPSPEELDGGRFFSPQELQQGMGKGIFTPNFEEEYARFFAHEAAGSCDKDATPDNDKQHSTNP